MDEPFRFTAGTGIHEALEADDRVVETLCRLGLKCVDAHGETCVAAEGETLADAARYHGAGLDAILDELNKLHPRK